MKLFSGRTSSISPFRRLVADLMHFSQKVPSVTLERPMQLAPLVEARQACRTRPCWSAIFIKAFAHVATRIPELRRSYMAFPWPRLYEHPCSVATLNVERQVHGEKMVLYAHIEKPEQHSLLELDAIIRSYCDRPTREIRSFRTAMRLTHLPWPLRRLVWWAALNVLGGQRAQHFGTFGTTTVAAQGAGVLVLVPLLTTTFYYSLFDAAGNLTMRLAFDHRVLDGSTAAQALVDMENALLNELLEEVQELAAAGAPAAGGSGTPQLCTASSSQLERQDNSSN